MNVQETTGIRELTVEELDQVNGGASYDPTTPRLVFDLVTAAIAVGGILSAIGEWLFGD